MLFAYGSFALFGWFMGGLVVSLVLCVGVVYGGGCRTWGGGVQVWLVVA